MLGTKWFLFFNLFWLFFVSTGIIGQSINTTIPSGSYIINMGVTPQTEGNALKPYGLVYELAKDHLVPVRWVINENKTKDGTDFTYNGTDYKGGPFVIPAEYRSAAVNAAISNWESQGVIGTTTSSEIVVPVFQVIDYFVTWTLDLENGSIAESYLENAGIPSAGYNWTNPQLLNSCNDIFAMPHADPVWDTHSNLYNWNQNFNGGIWAACHAVSALENIFDPSNPGTQLNFLSDKTGTASGNDDYADNSLILWDDHDDGTAPYNYAFPAHPIMQFMGILDDATDNGSEQVFLPHLKWSNHTSIAIWDPDQRDITSSNQQAAIVAFGNAFGDPTRGKVMYEAGHSHSKNKKPENIAAQRAFFNFSFWAAADNAIELIANILPNTTVNIPINLSASATGGAGSYTFEWTSSCQGTFSNPFSANTTFTPTSSGDCLIQFTVIDACGRTSFQSVGISVNSDPQPPTANNDVATISECGTVQINALNNDTDPEGGILTVTLQGNGSNGYFVNNGNGLVSYTPNSGYTGSDVVTYEICDPTGLCDNATITVSTTANTSPNATDDSEMALIDAPKLIDVLANDTDPENGSLSINILSQPANGMASVVNNELLFQPDAGFVGITSFIYQACDDGCTPLCDQATVTIDVGCTPIANEANILGLVFFDQNANGMLDGSEMGQDNVIVSLYEDINMDDMVDAGDTFIESQTTDHTGGFRFTLTNLPVSTFPGSYSAAIASSTDDSYQRSNGRNRSTDYEDSGDIIRYKGYRFTDLNLPADAVITSAILNLTGFDDGGITTVIKAEDTASPSAYSNANNYLSGRTTTIASQSWLIPNLNNGTNLTSPDFSAVVQEVLNNNNGIEHLSLILSNATGTWITYNFDDGSEFPQLTISYTSSQQSLDITSTKAVSNYENEPNEQIGACEWMWLENENDFIEHTFIEFDLSSLDPNCTISDANLVLTHGDGSEKGKSFQFGVRRVTRSWVEGIGDCFTYGTSGLTWETYDGNNNWTTPGGDFSSTVYATATGGADDPEGTTYRLNVTTLINEWISGTHANHGLALVPTDPKNKEAWFTFHSDDSGTAAKRPKLELTTTCPTGGEYVMEIDPASLPDGNPFLTTDNIETATFTDLNEVDCSNNFGFDLGNNPPVAVDDAETTEQNISVDFMVLGNDSDLDGDLLIVDSNIVSEPSQGGTVSFNDNGTTGNPSDDYFSYLPPPNFTGQDTFSYEVCDDGNPSLCDTAEAFVTVNALQNDAPVALDDIDSTQQDMEVCITVLNNDSDSEGDNINPPISTGTSPTAADGLTTNGGTLSINAFGEICYSPPSGFTGSDYFDYQICDPSGLCDFATVTVVVTPPANDPPDVLPNIAQACSGNPTIINVVNNDSDSDGNLDFSTLSITSNATNGIAVANGDGTVTYTSNNGFVGTDVFYYQICDDGLPTPFACSNISVTVTVTSSNTAPTAVADTEETQVNQVFYLNVKENDSDLENENLTVTIVSPPSNGATTVLSNGLVEYMPNTNFVGLDPFTYRICDDGCPSLCSQAVATVSVINPGPIAIDDFTTSSTNQSASIDVLNNDEHPIGLPILLNFSSTDLTSAQGGSITLIDNGTSGDLTDDMLLYAPPSSFTGLDQFDYQICDDFIPSQCSDATVYISILPPIDLELYKTSNPRYAKTNDTITITLYLINQGMNSSATEILVKEYLPAGLTYLSDNSGGSYDPVSSTWYISNLSSNGGSTSLDITAVVTDQDQSINTAEVYQVDQHDIDSAPNNMVNFMPAEDDEARLMIIKSVVITNPHIMWRGSKD